MTEIDAINLLLQKKDYVDLVLYNADPTTPRSLVTLRLNEISAYILAIEALQKQVPQYVVINQINRLIRKPLIKRSCPKCSEELKQPFEYCPHCGQRLMWR